MGARSAGARDFWSSASVGLICLGVVAAVVSCASGELAEGDLRPAPIKSQTFESPTLAPEPTRKPTATATPTVEPTATVEPTPTPTGTELYGALLVEGPYDWPLEMPDDLTEDELFAVNIFASAQNAYLAAVQGRSVDLAEFDPVAQYMVAGLVESTSDTIGIDVEDGVTQRFDESTDLISIVRGEASDDPPLFQTCEFIASTHMLDDGSEVDGDRFTVRRDLYFVENLDGYVYEGWRIVSSEDGGAPECAS